jgi:hypothetical protein
LIKKENCIKTQFDCIKNEKRETLILNKHPILPQKGSITQEGV